MSKTNNQRNQILKYLQSGKPITPIEALNKFGCFRLSARIKELRDAGHVIETKRVQINDSIIARYFLTETEK